MWVKVNEHKVATSFQYMHVPQQQAFYTLVGLEYYFFVYLDHITVSFGTELPLRVDRLHSCAYIYTAHMSPTLNREVLGSSVSNMISIT